MPPEFRVLSMSSRTFEVAVNNKYERTERDVFSLSLNWFLYMCFNIQKFSYNNKNPNTLLTVACS